jgi:hypothetical protein
MRREARALGSDRVGRYGSQRSDENVRQLDRGTRRVLTDAGSEDGLEPFTDTALYALGAYFADRHPDLMDDVVRQAQLVENAGAERYAASEGVTLESALQTLITGLAVRYYRAVAGSS